MIPFATEQHAIAWLFAHLRDDYQPASVLVAGARMTGWTYEAESDHVSTGRCALVDYDDPEVRRIETMRLFGMGDAKWLRSPAQPISGVRAMQIFMGTLRGENMEHLKRKR